MPSFRKNHLTEPDRVEKKGFDASVPLLILVVLAAAGMYFDFIYVSIWPWWVYLIIGISAPIATHFGIITFGKMPEFLKEKSPAPLLSRTSVVLLAFPFLLWLAIEPGLGAIYTQIFGVRSTQTTIGHVAKGRGKTSCTNQLRVPLLSQTVSEYICINGAEYSGLQGREFKVLLHGKQSRLGFLIQHHEYVLQNTD